MPERRGINPDAGKASPAADRDEDQITTQEMEAVTQKEMTPIADAPSANEAPAPKADIAGMIQETLDATPEKPLPKKEAPQHKEASHGMSVRELREQEQAAADRERAELEAKQAAKNVAESERHFDADEMAATKATKARLETIRGNKSGAQRQEYQSRLTRLQTELKSTGWFSKRRKELKNAIALTQDNLARLDRGPSVNPHYGATSQERNINRVRRINKEQSGLKGWFNRTFRPQKARQQESAKARATRDYIVEGIEAANVQRIEDTDNKKDAA